MDESEKEWALLHFQKRWEIYTRIWNFVHSNGGVFDDYSDEVPDEPAQLVSDSEFFCRDGKVYHREGWQVRWEWFKDK
jgi:hypothetical protein